MLGVVLFAIYINDVPKASKFETRLSADDTTLMLSGTDLNELNNNVNNALIKVESWLTLFGTTGHILTHQFLGRCAYETLFNPLTKSLQLKRSAAQETSRFARQVLITLTYGFNLL